VRARLARLVAPLLQSRTLSPRQIVVLLMLIVIAGGTLRALAAAQPDEKYVSRDAYAYSLLGESMTRGSYMQAKNSEDLRWPPGAPALFGAAAMITPGSPARSDPTDIAAAYWLQAIISTATLLLVFALAALLAGPAAGLIATALVAFYPPLIAINGSLMSETLGAFLATVAALTLVVALRARSWRFMAATGFAFGLLVLTRTDFLMAIVVVAFAIVIAAWRQGRGAVLSQAGAFAVTAILVLVPWTVYASNREGRFVPVTTGGGPALFIGTYLPGDGTTVGFKKALAPQLRERFPEYRGTKTYKIPATAALKLIAERHPKLRRDDALQREARHNLTEYALGDPIDFSAMMLSKVQRMWLKYYRGGGVHYISQPTRGYQALLVALGLLGLVALVVRRRLTAPVAIVFVIVLYSTALHAVVVSQARYNLPLMPMFVAGGVAALALAFSNRRTVQQTSSS